MTAEDGQNNTFAAHPRDALRAGEHASDLPEAADAALRFLGTIATPWEQRGACPRQGDPVAGPVCTLHLAEIYRPALVGLDAFEWIEVIYWLHGARRDLLQQSPKGDGAVRGTFALRSPLRPNPIGTSRVRLLRINGSDVEVRGLDCLNGTPLLDIKPDRCAYTPLAPARADD